MADDGPWTKYATPPADGPWTQYAQRAPAQPQPYDASANWGPWLDTASHVTFGAGPQIMAAVQAMKAGGDPNVYQQALAHYQQAEQDWEAKNPKTAIATGVGGGVVPAAMLTAAGLPVAAASATQGGTENYLQTGDPVQAAIAAGVSGAAGGAAQLAGKGAMALGRMAGAVAPAAATAPATPTIGELENAGGNAFDALRATGATYDPGVIRSGARDVAAELNAKGQLPILAPATHSLLDKQAALAPAQAPNPMQAMTGVPAPAPSPVPIAEVDAIRKALGNVRVPSNSATDAGAANAVRRGIIDLYENPPPNAVVSGNGADVARLSQEARGNIAAAKRSELLQGNIVNSENQASATGSGMNADNLYRQKARALLNPLANNLEGFSPPEVAAIQRVNDGRVVQNGLRRVGNMLGGGGGLGGVVAGIPAGIAGATGAGPYGAAAAIVPPLVGYLAKKAENAMSRNAFNAADELVRQRSPLYAQRAAAFVPPPSSVGGDIARVLGASVGGTAPGLGAVFGGQ